MIFFILLCFYLFLLSSFSPLCLPFSFIFKSFYYILFFVFYVCVRKHQCRWQYTSRSQTKTGKRQFPSPTIYGPAAQIQNVSLGGKHLYPLIHLAGFLVSSWLWISIHFITICGKKTISYLAGLFCHSFYNSPTTFKRPTSKF